MHDLFDILIPVSLLAVLTALGFGLYALFKGGDFSPLYSNKLMRLRVVLQFIAIMVLVKPISTLARAAAGRPPLNRIATRTGDAGRTRLASGAPVMKFDARVSVRREDGRTNACIGLARRDAVGDPLLDPMLARIRTTCSTWARIWPRRTVARPPAPPCASSRRRWTGWSTRSTG